MVDGYTPLVLEALLGVEALFSVHYFEYASDFAFPGERHDFWEFCYVDKGEVEVASGGQERHLEKAQVVFHKPGEFHSLWANGRVAPNLVVASFASSSPAMAWFEDQVLSVGEEQRALMARIIDEATAAFLTPLNDPHQKQLVRKASPRVGAEQMLKNSLEALLVSLYRAGHEGDAQPRGPQSLLRETSQQEFIDGVLAYFEANITKRLTLADICRDNLVGRSHLQKVFREKTGGGAMEYFGRLKVEAAKRLIREGKSNFTEIAAALGYNSIHYFSRHFKKITGMTPSEYASSVKVLTDRSRLD